MAHFAQLDENNIVIQVIVVDNAETHDVKGIENEELGIAFCKKLFGLDTKWKQTSYNGNIRKHYAGIGFEYHESIDAFVYPKPYSSWILNETEAVWESPVGPPPSLTQEEIDQRKYYTWDESNQTWVLTENAGNT